MSFDERTEWTPEDALRFYAESKHFDIVDGRTRILDTGGIASNALKCMNVNYARLKGDVSLFEMEQQLAEAKAEIERLQAHNARLMDTLVSVRGLSHGLIATALSASSESVQQWLDGVKAQARAEAKGEWQAHLIREGKDE